MHKSKQKPIQPVQPDNPNATALLERWTTEAEALLEAYPELDLSAECENGLFRHLLRGNLPMREAYELVHAAELRDAAVEKARRETEKQVLDSVRARGTRPLENGAASGSPFTLDFDPLRLSRKERREIVRRMLAGDPDPYRQRKEQK